MRIDKYLKLCRVLKRRTVSKEIIVQERVLVNNKVVKPGFKVSINDVIEIRFGNETIVLKVTDIKDHVRKDDVLYEVIEHKKNNIEI